MTPALQLHPTTSLHQVHYPEVNKEANWSWAEEVTLYSVHPWIRVEDDAVRYVVAVAGYLMPGQPIVKLGLADHDGVLVRGELLHRAENTLDTVAATQAWASANQFGITLIPPGRPLCI